jgi:hypothetical protein
MAVSEVDHHVVDVNASPGNVHRNSAVPVIESPIQPEREIKHMQESFSSVSSGRFSNVEHTPMRSQQMEANFSLNETPSNLLLSPVSPIFGSALKNISQNSKRTLSVCSTPKVHKKTLFSGNVFLDTVQEEGCNFTSGSSQNLKAKGDGSLNTLTVCGSEQPLNSPVSEVHTLPRPNFDLLSAAQDIKILEVGVENVMNADSFTNSAMYTVTQMLGLVNKEPNTPGVVEPVEICKSVQDIVPSTFIKSHVAEDISQKGDKCSDTVNHGSMSNFTSLVRNSADMITSSSLSSHTVRRIPVNCEQKSKQTHNYLHDSDDDIFVDLTLDHSLFTKCNQNTSVTSEVHTVDNNIEVDTNLPGNSGRSQHEIGDDDTGKQEFDTEVPSLISVAPQITKISKYSTIGHDQLTTAISKPSHSCLSSKHKLKDSAKITCTGNSLKTMGSRPNISSSHPKTINYDKESLSRIIGDESQYAEVTVGVNEKQKKISGSIDCKSQLDWYISLNNQKTVKKHNISTGNKYVDHYIPVVKNDDEISSGDDSHFQSPSLMRLKKRNQTKNAVKTDRGKHYRKNTSVSKRPKVGYLFGFLE